ncbi:aldo/keto reductase [Armatimonas sp.]|uniref:aldo/keto reductase n=1 Tax=Armatimonas sp. TaxID=1872638 RepID=UPI00286BCD70|nr:aldo/keto reductase [Armatimonas sp.]
METRQLGLGGPQLTTVGFGAWAAGGPYVFGWGPQDDNDSIAAMLKYLELGGNWIDTAAVYGFGHSETVVGKAVRTFGQPVFIATKCGRVAGPTPESRPQSDLRPESIRKQLDDSLQRLQLDCVDLFQIHWPDNDTGTALEDSWGMMATLQDEGKCRFIGVSNFDVPLLAKCHAIRRVQSLQPPYSLLKREIEAEILPWCLENGVGVVAYSPMQAGLLSGSFDINRVAEDDWRRKNPLFQEPQLSKNLAVVERLRPIAEAQGKTVGNLAAAWVLSHPALTCAIIGARSPQQVTQNLNTAGWNLTDEEKVNVLAALGD